MQKHVHICFQTSCRFWVMMTHIVNAFPLLYVTITSLHIAVDASLIAVCAYFAVLELNGWTGFNNANTWFEFELSVVPLLQHEEHLYALCMTVYQLTQMACQWLDMLFLVLTPYIYRNLIYHVFQKTHLTQFDISRSTIVLQTITIFVFVNFELCLILVLSS